MIPPGQFPPPPPGPSPYAPPRAEDEAVPTPRAPVLAPWAPDGAAEPSAPTPWVPAPSGGPPPTGDATPAPAFVSQQERALTPPHPRLAAPLPDGSAATGQVPTGYYLDHGVPPVGDGSAPSLSSAGGGAFATGATASSIARRRADRRWLLLGAAGALASGAVLATTVTFLLVRPWIARPTRAASAITADFSQVERWAKGPPPNEKRADALAGAATLVARQAARVGDGDVPRLEVSALTVDERAALEALMKWYAEDGGFTSAGCAPRQGATDAGQSAATATDGEKPVLVSPPAPAAYLVLGGLGLVTSAGTPEEIKGLEATLALANALRLRGNLGEHAIGVRLAVLSARWTHSRKYTVSPRFEAHRPRVEHFRAALARTAVCTVERLGPDDGWSFAAGDFTPDEGPRPPLGLLWPERERLVLKDVVGHWLVSTRDARTVEEVVESLAETPLPASVVLRAAVPPIDTLRALAKDYAEYDRLLPTQRSTRRKEPASTDRRSRSKRPGAPPVAATSIRNTTPDRKARPTEPPQPEEAP